MLDILMIVIIVALAFSMFGLAKWSERLIKSGDRT